MGTHTEITPNIPAMTRNYLAPLRQDVCCLLLLLFAVSTGALSSPTTVLAQDEPTIAVEGVVNINGEPAWAGIVINIEQDVPNGKVCGTATTTESGNYSVQVGSPCRASMKIVAELEQVEAIRRSDPLTLEDRSEALTFNPVFALSAAELAELPSRPAAADGDGAAGQALVQQTASVFDEVETLLIWLLVSGAILLTFMAVALIRVTNQRYTFLTHTFNKIISDKDAELSEWVEAVKTESAVQESRYKVFRWMVEGLVMSFVVIALIALGAAGKIEAQGIVSVLAAMVGYAAGRATN